MRPFWSFAVVLAVVAVFPAQTFAGGRNGRFCDRTICVHCCPPPCCCYGGRPGGGEESGMQTESGAQPRIIQYQPAVAPMMMAMPVAFGMGVQPAQTESGSAGDCRHELQRLDEKINKLSEQMDTITKQLGDHTLLIEKLMIEAKLYDPSK